MSEPSIRNISDTAHWSAVYRARETERPDALFRDPFARRLAGERGQRIFATLPASDRNEWAWVARTLLFDRFILDQVRQGADMVVNLAAGLDARPYRMALPSSLRWIEVDLPGILEFKEGILGSEKPACVLQRVRLDLARADGRRDRLESLTRGAEKALVVTEGLLIYLSTDEAGALARDLAAPSAVGRWVLDIVSPGLLRMMKKRVGSQIGGGAQFRFGPAEGPDFFAPYGWRVAETGSLLQTARQQKRLSVLMRLMALLPESNGRQGSRPWSGVCLMEKQGA